MHALWYKVIQGGACEAQYDIVKYLVQVACGVHCANFVVQRRIQRRIREIAWHDKNGPTSF